MIEKRIVILATGNEVKVTQYKNILGDAYFNVWSIKDLEHRHALKITMPPEKNTSYRDNAIIKCRAIAKAVENAQIQELSDALIIADDSGIEVEILDGFPGVISARWADQFASKDEAREELFSMVRKSQEQKQITNLNAKMTCELGLLFMKDKEIVTVTGEVSGSLTFPPRGNNHFLYDPMFVPAFQERELPLTAGEMSLEEKQKYSSRIVAIKKLKEVLPH